MGENEIDLMKRMTAEELSATAFCSSGPGSASLQTTGVSRELRLHPTREGSPECTGQYVQKELDIADQRRLIVPSAN